MPRQTELKQTLCNSITRPALANERLQTNALGQVPLQLNTLGLPISSCRRCSSCGAAGSTGATVKLAYRINLDEWNGRQRVQMVVEAAA